eukprot:998185-Pyramimonas_sp.AAC.1
MAAYLKRQIKSRIGPARKRTDMLRRPWSKLETVLGFDTSSIQSASPQLWLPRPRLSRSLHRS